MAEPNPAQKAPLPIEVAAGRVVCRRACGRSQRPPLRDGALDHL